MALNSAGLATAIQNVFESYPDSAADAASGLADAYYNYASAGQFGTSTIQLTPGHKSALESTLLSAIQDPESASASGFASAWSSGVATFWTAVPVAGAQSGVTNGCPGAAALSISLTSVFSNTENSASDAANQLATALHGATTTVTATVAPPPGTIAPIT